MQATEHVKRRASAAAAAAAAEILPINARRPPRSTNKATNAPSASPPPPPPPAAELQSPFLVADAGQFVEVAEFAAVAEGDGKAGRKSSAPPRVPPPALPRSAAGELQLLQNRAGLDADESFGSQERALSSYLKLHPVLSLESTSYQTLQLVADLVETTSIPTTELEIVSKPHDDSMLRSPNVAIGERPCCLGDRCICVWLARWRYGDATDLSFIGTEFLLPSQAEEFRASGKLPHTNGKCLVCSRYVHTFIYKCARADPMFKPDAKIPLQAFGNSLGVECGANLPTHSSVANDSDGYRSEAMLFVDEQWADTAAARGSMASMLWRPCVKFDSAHYVYVKDASGLPRMLQRNVAAEDESPLSHFCQPTEETTRLPRSATPLTRRPHPPALRSPLSST